MNTTFPMLIRREFWEHRSLWIAPLVWVGLMIFFFSWGVIHIDVNGHSVTRAHSVEEMGLNAHDTENVKQAVQMSQENKDTVFAMSFLAFTGLISVFSIVVVFFYLIDCLYTERKDRSILFWKSMPISDAHVVLSKLAVALVIVPIGVILLAAITQVLTYLIVVARFHDSVLGDVMPDWSFIAWLRSQAITLGMMLGGVLWYAPIAGYLLLLSAWAKNKVFLWTVLPPLGLMALEGMFFHSDNVARFLGRRFAASSRK